MSANNAQALRDRLLKRAQALKQTNEPSSATSTYSPLSASAHLPSTNNGQLHASQTGGYGAVPMLSQSYVGQRTPSQVSQLSYQQSPMSTTYPPPITASQPYTTHQQQPVPYQQHQQPSSFLQTLSSAQSDRGSQHSIPPTASNTREADLRLTAAQQQTARVKAAVKKTSRYVDGLYESMEREDEDIARELQRLNDRMYDLARSMQQSVDGAR